MNRLPLQGIQMTGLSIIFGCILDPAEIRPFFCQSQSVRWFCPHSQHPMRSNGLKPAQSIAYSDNRWNRISYNRCRSPSTAVSEMETENVTHNMRYVCRWMNLFSRCLPLQQCCFVKFLVLYSFACDWTRQLYKFDSNSPPIPVQPVRSAAMLDLLQFFVPSMCPNQFSSHTPVVLPHHYRSHILYPKLSTTFLPTST